MKKEKQALVSQVHSDKVYIYTQKDVEIDYIYLTKIRKDNKKLILILGTHPFFFLFM